MQLIKKLNINLKDLATKKFTFIFALYILTICILSYVFYNLFIIKYPNIIEENGDLIFKNIPFEYGVLIDNLVQNSTYSIPRGDIDLYLSRLPVLPIFILLLSFVTKNLLLIIILKNIVLFSIIYFTLFNFLKYKKKKFFYIFNFFISFFL